jgi:hypothetical protein
VPRFVRFQSNLRDIDLSVPLGVFHAAGKLMDSGQLDPWLTERTEEICDWFNEHLTVPRLGPGLMGAVFWFRSEPLEMIQRLWELVILLEESGATVELIHTTRPGWVRYADEFQVAAIPTRR